MIVYQDHWLRTAQRYALTAQRIFVDRARPFCAHSCADGRTTSFAYSE